MSAIPGLGGHDTRLWRGLMEIAERAAGDEVAAGPTDPGGPHRSVVPARAPGAAAGEHRAVILDLSEQVTEQVTEQATDQATEPADQTTAPVPVPRAPQSAADGAAAAPARSAPAQAAELEAVPLDQLVAVLKRSGTDFRQAARLLADVDLGRPLPPLAVLRAMWDARPETPARAPAAVRDLPLDRLVRTRDWRRANPARAHEASPVPSLRTVVVERPETQRYVAGLTTAEYQRLVVLLGEGVPGWFAKVRGSSGPRAVLERAFVARLATIRVAGLRWSGWGLGAAGVAIAWVVGVRTGSWW